MTGEGLDAALEGADVVVDVSNSPSFEDAAVLKFFQTSTGNLLAAAAAAGVGHYVALSVVGTERLSESGYFRAKIAQENLIKESSIPYSIVHATQFFEFVKRIAADATEGDTVRLAPVLIQPMAAADVASAVARISVGSPVNGTVEVAGPEQFRLDEIVRRALSVRHDPRNVVADPHARYFAAKLDERMLVPGAVSSPWEASIGLIADQRTSTAVGGIAVDRSGTIASATRARDRRTSSALWVRYRSCRSRHPETPGRSASGSR